MGVMLESSTVTATEANVYPRIKAYEQHEFERLTSYLERLDADGWVEQSYCTDWPVYQVVSHIGSGSRIGGLRLAAWLGNGPAVTRETMQQIWGHFDSLGPTQMFSAYAEAVREYLSVEGSTPDQAGLQEVDGFAGRRPLSAYQLARTWELACHSWDVYVARDRSARLAPEAVSLLAEGFSNINLPLDKQRAGELSRLSPVVFRLRDSGRAYSLDLTAERPRVQAASAEGPLVIEGPDEEVIRFLSGRHFLPGARSGLEVSSGSAQDLASLRRAFR
jgi:uncharacterized protein (TIGR03083 family)